MATRSQITQSSNAHRVDSQMQLSQIRYIPSLLLYVHNSVHTHARTHACMHTQLDATQNLLHSFTVALHPQRPNQLQGATLFKNTQYYRVEN